MGGASITPIPGLCGARRDSAAYAGRISVGDLVWEDDDGGRTGSPPRPVSGSSEWTAHSLTTAGKVIRPSRRHWPSCVISPRFLADERDKQDWALTDVHDVEAFLAGSPKA
ncbi:hypothetical protein AB0M19_34780 [Streptomyces sp. NPDC051920]|uniref:hypothetical protein n=1 Tax=Streptomyces sp. NPDC051920 TaxID=3155523 RepID=UPI003437C577